MLDIAVIAGAGLLVCSVTLVFGCLCHIFKKSLNFSTFENSYDVENGSAPGSPSNISTSDSSIASQITFEPLPDILAKTVSATALKPRIKSVEREWQKGAAKQVLTYKPFHRSQLMYIKELGLGWFGQVLASDADDIFGDYKKNRVVVKLLKDDANHADRHLFLEEMVPYKELEHENILKLLGQCTESYPFLVILEYSPHGDLKSYLRRHKHEAEIMVKNGLLLDFLVDISAGLACLHSNGYVHNDLASRNCLVMADMTIKVGDYGVAEDHFREDYYDTGQDLLPIRWMAPESLTLNNPNHIWQVSEITKVTNVWSFGVIMWEVAELAKQPYEGVKDDDILQNVVLDKTMKLGVVKSSSHIKQRLNEVMQFCWLQPHQRLTTDDVNTLLTQIKQERDTEAQAEFDAKWQSATSNERETKPETLTLNTKTPADGKDFSKGVNQVNKLNDSLETSDGAKTQINFKDEQIVKPSDRSDSSDKLTNVYFSEDEPSFIEPDHKTKIPSSSLVVNKPKSDVFVSPEKLKTPSYTPVQGSPLSQSYQLTSTPVSNLTSFEYETAASTQIRTDTDTNYMTAESSIDTNNTCTAQKSSNTLNNKLHSTTDKSTIVGDGGADSDAESESSNQSVEFVELDNSDDESTSSPVNRISDDKLQSLKLSIEQALGSSQKSSTGSENVECDGEGSPKDEYDLAREIYMSKGTSIPHPTHRTARSLTTIPEDAIPMEASPLQRDKFDDSVFTSGVPDTFEWDDYIGDELVGKVRYSDESPQHVMEFTDWTLEQDSSSESQPSMSGAESNPNSTVNSPYATSGSEVNRSRPAKKSPSSYIIHDLLTNRTSSNYTATNKLTNKPTFYSLSHSIDLETSEHASPGSRVTGPTLGFDPSGLMDDWEMD